LTDGEEVIIVVFIYICTINNNSMNTVLPPLPLTYYWSLNLQSLTWACQIWRFGVQ